MDTIALTRGGRRIQRTMSVHFGESTINEHQPPQNIDFDKVRSILKKPIDKPRTILNRRKSTTHVSLSVSSAEKSSSSTQKNDKLSVHVGDRSVSVDTAHCIDENGTVSSQNEVGNSPDCNEPLIDFSDMMSNEANVEANCNSTQMIQKNCQRSIIDEFDPIVEQLPAPLINAPLTPKPSSDSVQVKRRIPDLIPLKNAAKRPVPTLIPIATLPKNFFQKNNKQESSNNETSNYEHELFGIECLGSSVDNNQSGSQFIDMNDDNSFGTLRYDSDSD